MLDKKQEIERLHYNNALINACKKIVFLQEELDEYKGIHYEPQDREEAEAHYTYLISEAKRLAEKYLKEEK